MQQAGLMTDEQRRTGKIGTSPWYSIDLNDWEPFLRLWPIDEAGRIIYDTSTATKLDPTRHIVHRGHLLTQARDNWGGPGRAITSWWLLRGLGRDWFARFMERYGSPFPVGKTNVQDPQSVNLLQTAFSLASKIGGLVIGQDDAVELQSAMVQGGAEGHERWHNVCNDAISFAITGYKSSQKPAGLNAGEEGMISNIREDVRLFDQKTVSDTLVKQLFDRFLKFNGLQGCVRTVWGGLSDDDAATFATLVKTMSDAGFEPTDEAMPVVEERTGLQWQRKQIPTDLTTKGGKGPDGGDGEDGVETLAVRRFGKLVFFSAGGETSNIKHQTSNELDKVVEKRVERLAAAYKGAMAPFREIILSSDSREDCLKKLKAAYADWKPDRLADELEVALQMCAAAGAVKAKPE
jgi:phage gp29-like protein